jgi:hypothetical protein
MAGWDPGARRAAEVPMVFVGFSTPRRWNPLSWLIRVGTHSPASHAWLLVDDPLFKLRLVLEAHTTGFRLVTLARFARDNEVVAIVEPAHPLEPGMPQAGRWLGDRFDAIGLVGMAWVVARRFFHLSPGRNPFRSTQALFCSESVVRTLQAARYPGAEALEAEEEAPADVLAFLRDSGSKVLTAAELNLAPRRLLRKAAPAPRPAPVRAA